VKRTLALVAIGWLIIGCGGSGGGGGNGDAVDDTTTPQEDTATPPVDTATPPPDSQCVANCEGKECGDDGCGGSCGPCTGEGVTCDEEGKCVHLEPSGGACTGEADLEIIKSQDLKTLAKTCAMSNMGDKDKTVKCIQDETGLTDECVACFGLSVQCGSQCAAACSDSSTPQECDKCLEDKGCSKEFEECSGLAG
jgi:hypothetical protein